jgi:hypothetical protein
MKSRFMHCPGFIAAEPAAAFSPFPVVLRFTGGAAISIMSVGFISPT